MWSLGCLLGDIYFGRELFYRRTLYQVMKAICQLIGLPGDHLLNAGKNSSECFKTLKRFNHKRWRLKTPREYKKSIGVWSTLVKRPFNRFGSLDEAVVKHSRKKNKVEFEDRIAFLQLLKQLLDVDANSRITSKQALTDSFVTMGHLKEALDCCSYYPEALRRMSICTPLHSDASDVPLNNNETDMKSIDVSGGVPDTENARYPDAPPDSFCQDPPIKSCGKRSQKEHPITFIADNSNLEKSNIDTTHNKATPYGAAATITPTDRGDVDETRPGLPKRLRFVQRVRRAL
ncbi:hypothetical protein KUCAC02_004915 [Chaenocephalus aceratus]|uniref:Uncharacterized protein n=1 Tax=Chaenocephalus aceratus TaxID=36190 RepID=A0ACB9X0P2_CHAAC|nr:hypothetical protein KUCAC02_004915 [Chaenocephalus aceratus]